VHGRDDRRDLPRELDRIEVLLQVPSIMKPYDMDDLLAVIGVKRAT